MSTNVFLRCIYLLLVMSISLVTSSETRAEDSLSDLLIPRENMATTRVYLQTIGRGSQLPQLYGHTQLHVHDSVSRRNFVVSWGFYDSRDPFSFLLESYRGTVQYLIAAFPTAAVLDMYRREERSLVEDEFSLSIEQKIKLVTSLEQILKPPYNTYLYKIYEDNCSTRLRDLIDGLTDHKLQEFMAKVSANISIRQILREHQSTIPLTGWLLDIIGNREIDKPLSSSAHMSLHL